MPPRRDQGRKGRYHKPKPKSKRPSRGEGRHQRTFQKSPPTHYPKRPQKNYHKPPEQQSTKREVVAKGQATDLGLDGKLRIEMEPLRLDVAAQLSRGKGAVVFTPRGDRLGQVNSIIGTLDRPIAIVRVFPDMRKEASEVQGRELFLG